MPDIQAMDRKNLLIQVMVVVRLLVRCEPRVAETIGRKASGT